MRAWMLRRALGRMRITEARSAAQLGNDWVWPYWLDRQLDPSSAAFVPRGHLSLPTNVTARNWTAVGNLDSPWEAIVDPRGLVTPWFDGWSLDWWVGADDRWHLPSREVAVRQRLVDDMPVVETAMRIPSGDIVQRVYGVRNGGDELVIVEIENQSPLPVALALAVRPVNPEGLAVVERIDLHDGTTVTVDGRVAMLLPKAPSRMAGSTFKEGDVVSTVLRGDAGDEFGSVRCPAGLASAAFIWPLPHRQTMRVALPIVAAPRTRRRGRTLRRVARATALPPTVPTAQQVANGWRIQGERGMRVVLPDVRLQSAVDANRRFLLLLHDGTEITPGPSTYHRFWFRDAAYMVGALDRYGYADEAESILRSYPDRQHGDGFFFGQSREWDANGCALHAMAEHWRLHRDTEFASFVAPSVARGAEWIERKRQKRRGVEPGTEGLLPAGISAEHLGPYDFFYWDDFWGVRGLLDAVDLLHAAGEEQAASSAAAFASAFRRDLDASLARTASRLGTDAMPAGPNRRIDPAIIGSLAACWPLQLFAADDRRVQATVGAVREQFLQGDAFFQGISHAGLGTYLTLQLGFVELEAGDRRALDRLKWLLGAATPTWTWPEAVHPRLAGGCVGDGHHGRAAADLLTFVRNLLVRDVDGGLALCTLVPDDWLGRPLEVHDAPTRVGRLSFALRWHGDRPALLWELEPHDDTREITITTPGLDPSWSTTERSGEALLAPVLPPGTPVSLRR